ncbi:MAG: hypothetical protein WAL10_04320, partial [Acetobacteraceae bacterium]
MKSAGFRMIANGARSERRSDAGRIHRLHQMLLRHCAIRPESEGGDSQTDTLHSPLVRRPAYATQTGKLSEEARIETYRTM